MRIAGLLIALLLVSASVAANPYTIMVIPFENATSRPDLDSLEEGMAELITVCLSASDSTRLVHSAEARAPLTELASSVCNALGLSVASYAASSDEISPQLVAAEQPEVQLHLIEGLGHYYNGNYAGAFPAFLAILREEPDHAMAHYWLGMSFHQAELENLARTEFHTFLQRYPDNDKASEVSMLLGKIEPVSQ